MGDAKVRITAEDNASSVIDTVAKKLGVFSQQGIAMGIGFAALTKSIQFVEEGIQAFVSYIGEGITKARQFDLSLTRLAVSTNDFDLSIGLLKDSIKTMSMMFATDVNTMTSAMQRFIREGYKASEAVRMLFETNKLAIATNEDLSTTQEAAITTMEIFGYGANSSSYIMNKLNQITSTTGLSISEIDRIMGRSAITIQETGVNLDTVANIFYTLDERGVKSRSMLTEFDNTLKNLNTTTLQTIRNTVDLDEKYKMITGTIQFTTEMFKSMGEISQLELGEGFKTFGVPTKIAEATTKYIDILRSKGIDTLDELNEVIAEGKLLETIGSENENWFLNITGILPKLLRMYTYYNELQSGSNDLAKQGNIEQLETDYINLTNALDNTNKAIVINQDNIANLGKEQTKLTALHGLNEDIRYMGMGLEDASYAEKIQNSATRELIDSIRVQREEIDKLNTANKQYSLESEKNNLAIMKIQYESMGQRRGLTRGQQKMIEELQKADMGLRISMTENQIAMDQKTLDLSPEEKRLNQLSMWYNEEVYLVQDAYNIEMKALQDKIDKEAVLLNNNLNNIRNTNHAILQNEIDTYNARQALVHGVSPAIGSNTSYVIPTPTPVASRIGAAIPRLQTGGYVQETGLAIVDKGETVTKNAVNNVNINIRVDKISSDIDMNRLAAKLASATKAQLIRTDGTTKYGMR